MVKGRKEGWKFADKLQNRAKMVLRLLYLVG